MKIRQLSKLDVKKIGPGVEWIDIVIQEDNVGFTEHELHIQGKHADYRMNLEMNHIYYVIEGNCKIKLSNGSSYDMQEHFSLAVPQGIGGQITVENDCLTRIIVFHVKPDPNCSPTDAMLRKLDDIVGGPRDIDWSRGHSRRLFAQPDGFNLSIHNTFADAGQKTQLEYKNNFEVNYIYKGNMKYIWNDQKDSVHFEQDNPEEGDGMVMILDQNDKHWVETFDKTTFIVCAFFPPLKGTENHDLAKGTSSY